MNRLWILPAIAGGLLAFATTSNVPVPDESLPESPNAAVVTQGESESLDITPGDFAGFDRDQLNSTPLGGLLDINPGNGGVQPLQGRPGTLPAGWQPDPPLDLEGDMPSDEEVRKAIVDGVEYILSQQKEDGHWDVVLTGTLLSETADQAVDAIAATSLAAIALRYHYKVDPVRINKACRDAALFVIDRVYRGKLPMKIWYANWRYNLGLKFLHMEYMHYQEHGKDADDDYIAEIVSVSRRMVTSMLQLQMSNSDAPRLERKRRTRLASRHEDKAMPTKFGVVLFPPTDEEYRGGARVIEVIPGSVAEQNGVKVGDRIVEVEGLRVENAYDYYMEEATWVGLQRVSLRLKREGGGGYSLGSVRLENTWPGYLGLKLRESSQGPVVEGFLPFSPCQEKLEIGDIVTEIDGEEISTIADFQEAESKCEIDRRVRIYVLRGDRNRRKLNSVDAAAAPEGWFGFDIEEEDKGRENGVIVNNIGDGSPAKEAGLEKGDRVTWIGKTPILGLDHLYDFAGTVAGGKPYLVKWVRNGQEMQAEMIAEPTPQPFKLDADLDVNRRTWQVYIKSVEKRGAADKAGIKKGDIIVAINGTPTRNIMQFQQAYYRLSAGQEVTFTMQRNNNTVDITMVLPKADPGSGPEVEEGGWAYYPNMGESPSFCTATAMLTLMDVEGDMKIKGMYRATKQSLDSAARLVESLRGEDPNHGGDETYAYRMGSYQAVKGAVDVRGCQGRNAVCDLALVRYGKVGRRKAHLKKTIDLWVKHRHELDAVRRMEYYANGGRGSPHNFDRWNNAAYYWMFGHYHTLLAAKEVGGRTESEINEICTKAVIKIQRDDGTWLGHPSFGELCGTSLALWILGETEGDWHEHDSGSVTTQDKTDSGN